MILRLTKKDIPDGSLIGVLNDIHVPHHDASALDLVVEAFESSGVSHIILNGDILDCGPVSRHGEKRNREVLDSGSLLASIEPGRWILDWANTRPCWYIRGNHEAWLEQQIERDPALKGAVTPEQLMKLPAQMVHLPSQSRIRLGSLNWEHGDGFFPRGSGGANPAATIQRKAPDQTTAIGHLHQRFFKCWTTVDERGVPRTRSVYGMPHLSLDEAHEDYMGTYTGWQKGATMFRIYWIDDRPWHTMIPLDIHHDKRNRPVLDCNGKVWR